MTQLEQINTALQKGPVFLKLIESVLNSFFQTSDFRLRASDYSGTLGTLGTMYINCHSYYSLRYGTMSVEQLVLKAQAAGADTIALTDINNSTAIPEFAGECSKNNIRPVACI